MTEPISTDALVAIMSLRNNWHDTEAADRLKTQSEEIERLKGRLSDAQSYKASYDNMFLLHVEQEETITTLRATLESVEKTHTCEFEERGKGPCAVCDLINKTKETTK